MLIEYHAWRPACFFFIIFLFIGFMFLMSLAMAVVYSTYIRRQQKQLKKQGKVTNRGLKAAFAILQSAPAPPDPPPEEGFCDRKSMVSKPLIGVKVVNKKQQAHLVPCLLALAVSHIFTQQRSTTNLVLS